MEKFLVLILGLLWSHPLRCVCYSASALVATHTGIGSPLKADESVPSIFKLSYCYYSFVGTIIVFLVGLPVSYLTESPDFTKLDPKLFSPVIRPYLPPQPSANEYTLVNSNPTSQELVESLKEKQTTCT